MMPFIHPIYNTLYSEIIICIRNVSSIFADKIWCSFPYISHFFFLLKLNYSHQNAPKIRFDSFFSSINRIHKNIHLFHSTHPDNFLKNFFRYNFIYSNSNSILFIFFFPLRYPLMVMINNNNNNKK